MIFRQLFDATSSTYTYLLADETSREALIIDSVFEQFERDAALLRELGLVLRYTLDTHVHADHVTGAWLLHEAFGSRIVLSKRSGATGIDIAVDDSDRVTVGAITLEVRATPGHTDGCVTYVLADHRMAFTGDALLIRSAGRTDFQHGNAHVLYHSIVDKIFTLPDDCLLYPGHDYSGRTVTTVGEEKRYNPRVGGEANEADFVGFMENLGLPHPKQIDHALPANLVCGRPGDGVIPHPADWGPVTRTFGGGLEIDPHWVAEHRGEVTVLDVREPSERGGELGCIDGSLAIPLGELRGRLGDVPNDRPVVCVCRSGRRSAQAAAILEKNGITATASLAGGMIRWRALGL